MAPNQIAFSTNATERMRIDNTGLIGIGTATPAMDIHISRSFDGDVGLRLNNPATTNSAAVGIYFDQNANKGWIGVNDDGATFPAFANRMAITDGTSASGLSLITMATNDLRVYTNSNGSTGNERMRVTYQGLIGIGTATPNAVLDVYGTGTIGSAIIIPRETTALRPTGVNGMIRYNTNSSKFEVYENGGWVNMATGAGGADNLGNHQATTAIVAVIGTGATPSYTFAGDLDTGMWKAGENQVAFNTGSTERMRINSNGNVGIGSSNPGSKLDVVGDANINGLMIASYTNSSGFASAVVTGNNAAAAADNGAAIEFYGTTTMGYVTAQWNAAATTNSYLGFQNRTSGTVTEKMRLTSTGNLGIGTTTTNGRLDVWGTGAASAIVVPRDIASQRPTASVNGMIRYNTNTSKFEVYENGGWINMATGAGGGSDNLGNHTATTAIVAVTGTAATPSYTFSGDSDTGIWPAGPGALGFSTNSTERMRIDNVGNIGLGTTSTTNRITLTGTGADQTIGMGRETTAATDGRDLILEAGGAKSGGTGLMGGDLVLKSGISTGTGYSTVQIHTGNWSGGGSSDNSVSETARFGVPGLQMTNG